MGKVKQYLFEDQPLEAPCRKCDGHGYLNIVISMGDDRDKCPDCKGEGWIKCDKGGIDCPFDYCYCEAAWERQQEDRASNY